MRQKDHIETVLAQKFVKASFLSLQKNIEMSIHAFFFEKSGKALEETIEFLLVTLERMFLIVVTKIGFILQFFFIDIFLSQTYTKNT